MIVLATGILRDPSGAVLLVASRYANHPQPLWNLPGGRQQPGELLDVTVARELLEETGLHVRVRELAYVSESYDGTTHVVNATFELESLDGFASAPPAERGAGDHVDAVAWVPAGALRERLAVTVVREPLLDYLEGRLGRRYAGFPEAGITIVWPGEE